MARISNTSIYPNIDPVLSDYFVLTDANDDLSTKTCTLESVQSLFGLADTTVTVTVSSVLLNALWTQPLTLIAAPGSGYVLNVKNIILFMDAGSVAYGFDGNASTAVGTYSTGNIALATFNSATDIVLPIFNGGSQAIPENTALILTGSGTTGGTPAGNGVMYIKITYQTLKSNSTF